MNRAADPRAEETSCRCQIHERSLLGLLLEFWDDNQRKTRRCHSRKHGEALLFPQNPDPTRTAAGDDLLKVPVSPWVLHAPGSVVQGQARDDTAAPNAAARHSPRGCSSEVPGAHLMNGGVARA
ncbi:unnamed protein product [Miscanthus lutarioriparius]|uniref:Uncharacterized protein n=1 Tax=Miscanthus lutarioriparius TaxID=422564 RepID=A0A811SM34_9POAL|nr:unnamed protein product [Miscanthus lutarioriparius]